MKNKHGIAIAFIIMVAVASVAAYYSYLGNVVTGDINVGGQLLVGTTTDIEGKLLVGANASETDASNFQSIFSHDDTGETSARYGAIFAETKADSGAPGRWGVAIDARAETSSGVRAIALYGEAVVDATADAGGAYAGYFLSDDTHAGGVNYAVFADAANGNTSYAFYGDEGLFWQEDEATFGAAVAMQDALSVDANTSFGETVVSDGPLWVYRTRSGNASTDQDMLCAMDGSTVKGCYYWDNSPARLATTTTFFAPTSNSNSTTTANSFVTSTLQTPRIRTYSTNDTNISLADTAEYSLDVTVDDGYTMLTIANNSGDLILAGYTSGDYGSMSLDDGDGGTAGADLMWDGATFQVNNALGDIEINAKDGSDIVLGNTTIMPAILEAPNGDTISGGQVTKAVHSVDQAGVVTYFFSGVCNIDPAGDGSTVALVAGATTVTVEFNTAGACTGSATVCVDATGALGDSATKCATLLSGALNSASVTDFNGYSTVGSVGVISVTENLNFDARESLTNLAVTSATAIGEEPASKHHMFHCTHTVTATGEAILTLINKGALTVCSADGNSPIWWQCNVVDSAGEVVSIPNTIFNAEQAGAGKYLMVAKDSGGGHDIDTGDIINCLILSHH
jgi:hypothetical protein